MNFNIILCDFNKEITNELQKLEKYDNVQVKCCYFQDLHQQFDCIISPANSFGLMHGGADRHICNYFSSTEVFIPHIQNQLSKISNKQQMPGTALLLSTGNSVCPYLLHSPTMMVPSNITDRSVIYWCCWNIFNTVNTHNISFPTNKIKTICIPSLGTGAGNVSGKHYCELFNLAYTHFIKLLNKKNNISWGNGGSENYKQLQDLLQSQNY